jgi:hypothetical protein
MGASDGFRHLFARRYDFPVTLDRLRNDWRLFELELQEKARDDMAKSFGWDAE